MFELYFGPGRPPDRLLLDASYQSGEEDLDDR